MKKTFSFGKIAWYGTRKINEVTVGIELKDKDGKPVFSASGDIWNASHTDIVCCGQCLDELATFVKTPKFKAIHRLWKAHHLNDMKAARVHQEADPEFQNPKELVCYRWGCLKPELRERKKKLHEAVNSCLREGLNAQVPEDELALFNMKACPYSTYVGAANYQPDLYDYKDKFAESALHVRYEEHPEGLLCKPCAICGWKYGEGWQYRPIPQEDLDEINALLDGTWEPKEKDHVEQA